MCKTAVVMGYGRSGQAAEALLKNLGYDVEVWDKKNADAAEPPRSQTSLPAPQPAFAVVSPGIPLTHPWFADCRARGLPVKSELQFGCEELKRRGWKLMAVTGSKGKSSVVKVVADAINRSGGHAVACGNYGVPVCEVALGGPVGWAVVEVSSFMMETTTLPADFFEAAVILNLQEDHLDRHGSIAVYHGLKKKLLAFAKKGWIAEEAFSARDSRLRQGGGDQGDVASPLAQSYFDNRILFANGAAAAELMRIAGLTDAQIAEGFATFVALPHRMNLVCARDGVRYVDDSKATSLKALEAGVIMAATPVRLIAGGLPKGDDPKSVLTTLTKRVRKVYLIGQCAEAFAAAWRSSVDCEICGTMSRAVEAAARDAGRGETVLLSPGTASFDQFKSYGERGEVFAALVQKGK